ncbi:hypothetical protein DFH01_11225 [Falsiroseomonas bella]|uniref:DUF1622 domain-containing protein n=1 Tax=Falsiroseomonas bella TaxID=2184016 RepID=A0A317FGC7_9PROT|nr:DUF1622 domain-containing protein [Falsiroseomonas bella]PWS37402.1 hypothetical protein DFH01_11225 [Falsiroseomonas bella]
MEELIKDLTQWVAIAVEVAAVLVIAYAGLEAGWRVLGVWIGRGGTVEVGIEHMRLRLARWLAVALEFTLAADILRTAVAPTWDDIGKLAAIAALRTVLNFFLQREIEAAARAEAHRDAAS